MKCSGRFTIICTRVTQLWMLVLTWAMFAYGMSLKSFGLEWCLAVLLFEITSMNIVRGEFNDRGLVYARILGERRVSWEDIYSIRILSMGNGFVLRLRSRSLLTRYKFILSCKPGVFIFHEQGRDSDPLAVTQLRKLVVGKV